MNIGLTVNKAGHEDLKDVSITSVILLKNPFKNLYGNISMIFTSLSRHILSDSTTA